MRPTCTPCQGRESECQWPLREQEAPWRKEASELCSSEGSRESRLPSAIRGRESRLNPGSQATPSLQFQPNLSNDATENRQRNLNFVSTDNPEIALRDFQVFRLFRYYKDHLASWYDLNDSQRHFTDMVPVKARYSPLLLSAILAFSAISLHSTSSESLVDQAEFYHLESVQIILRMTGNIEDVVSNDELLAAICLLRSFEIISREKSLT